MNQEQINSVGTWMKRIGITVTLLAIAFLLTWSFCSSGAKQPLTPGEDKHWTDPAK